LHNSLRATGTETCLLGFPTLIFAHSHCLEWVFHHYYDPLLDHAAAIFLPVNHNLENNPLPHRSIFLNGILIFNISLSESKVKSQVCVLLCLFTIFISPSDFRIVRLVCIFVPAAFKIIPDEKLMNLRVAFSPQE